MKPKSELHKWEVRLVVQKAEKTLKSQKAQPEPAPSRGATKRSAQGHEHLSPLAVKPLLLAAAPLSLQMKGQELPAPSAFRGRLNGS